MIALRGRGTQVALAGALVAISGFVGAIVAHVAIDLAGDVVLAHDAYDDLPHDSRAIVAFAVVALLLFALVRAIFSALDRRYGSRRVLSRFLRETIGGGWPFAARSSFVALVALVAMESLDCALAHADVDGIAVLFGGSLLLGVGTTVTCGLLVGLAAHAMLRFLAHHEPIVVALIVRLVRSAVAGSPPARTARTRNGLHAIGLGLLLSRSGSKRGPPLSTPI